MKTSTKLKVTVATAASVGLAIVGLSVNAANAQQSTSPGLPVIAPYGSHPAFPTSVPSRVPSTSTTVAPGNNNTPPTVAPGNNNTPPTVTPYNSTIRRFLNYGDNACMTSYHHPVGYAVLQYACNGAVTQQFTLGDTGTAYFYQLHNQDNNACIDNYGNTANNGAVQAFEPCINAINEQYLLYDTGYGTGTFYIETTTQLCLSSNFGNVNAPIIEYACNGNPNQVWHF